MKLNAIDTEELKIIATVLQDGLIEVNDVKYLPSIRTFIVMITRFMWEEKIVNKTNNRTKAVLVFEDVLAVHSKNIDQMDKAKVLELLTFNFYNNKSKNIEIELLFNNDATIKLETEVVQAKLEDQGDSWTVEEVNKKNDTQT
ncbi:MAG: DUF2948 family protein [Candidatus Pelagibacterales bacterium]|jgi:hypothetical protein|tara:strand:+ start:713 stop:1141 length:429 start_codon:yes stop_codon:yes gene_type:complete